MKPRYYSQPISKTKYIYEDMSQYNEVCPFIIPLSLMVTSYKLYASNRKIQRWKLLAFNEINLCNNSCYKIKFYIKYYCNIASYSV